MLKITMQMMLDTRTNPFDDAQDKSNNKGLHSVYVPVRIWFELPDGTLLHYTNRDTADHGFSAASNRWEEGEARWGDAFLCYYSWTDIKKNTPCSGWMTNKPCIGRSTDNAPEMWQKRGEGDFITLPGQVLMQGGTLRVEVGTDVAFGHGSEIKGWFVYNGRIAFDAKWLLYKSMTVAVVDSYGKALPDNEAVVRSTVLNVHAKDPLTINTICGTAVETTPTARGVISLKAANREASTALQQLTRGDLTDSLENLLIAAVASQYDCRHTTLSGTVAPESFGMYGLYADRAQPAGRVFTPDQADYDVASAEVTTRFVELSPQKYKPQESKNSLWPTL